MSKRLGLVALILAAAAACTPLEQSRELSGNFEVTYVDNLRVYIDDNLVAEASSGQDATIEWEGESFQISHVCGDNGTECPSETYWGEVAIEQPWGPEYRLLNFVNLDLESDDPGQRMGGTLDDDGTFDMLSGLAIGANPACAAVGIGVVTGEFSTNNQSVQSGVIAYGWAGGCSFNGVDIGTNFKLETDYTAIRTGDYDVSSVTPEEPIDEEGEEVDPEDPEESYELADSEILNQH
ncbi:MAG: hypothetical protein HN348_16020 [Proteobacteria bacterium]|nr:hypothetical protein [Pseudomonadota bacterium]